MPEGKKSSLKSVALAIQQHKNEVPDKEQSRQRKLMKWKHTKNNSKISGKTKTPEEIVSEVSKCNQQ